MKVIWKIYGTVLIAIVIFIYLKPVCILAENNKHYAMEDAFTLNKKIKVGCFEDAGFFGKTDDGDYYGFAPDYLKEIAKYTGWEYEYIYGTSKECLERLETGEIDLFFAAQYSEERNKKFEYCQYDCGIEYAILYAEKDNNSIYYEDYEAFDGIKIGMQRVNYQSDILKEYAREHNFQYEPYYYENVQSMLEALKQKEIDAFVNGSLYKVTDAKIIAKFGVSPFYFITKKGNTELMDQVNEAMEQLRNDKALFNSELYTQHYGAPYQTLVGITREEAECVEECGTLKVVCNPDGYPIDYIEEETGEHRGIYGDIWGIIEENSAMEFELIKTESLEESWRLIKSGEADLISGVYASNQLGEDYNIFYSTSYYTANNSVIGRRGMSIDTEKELTVAIPKSFMGIGAYIKENFPNWTIQTYSSIQDCMKAVSKKKVDITIIDSIFLQTTYNLNYYKNLVVVSTVEVEIPISIGISKKNKASLQSVLNKTIGLIPQDTIKKCVTANTINILYHPTIEEIIQEYIWVLFIVILLFILVILCIIKQRESHFKKIAMIDPLTKIWNRNQFEKEGTILINKNKNKIFYLVSIDVDKFKYINDQYGVKFGDTILKEMAEKIQQLFAKKGYYARGVGDRFFVLLEELDSEKRVEWQELIIQTKMDFIVGEGIKKQFHVPVKFGIYIIYPRKEELLVSECIDKANIAKETIKRNRNKNVAIYDKELEKKIATEIEIENSMEQALEKKEFKVFYQPKYDLKTQMLIGAEALVRWENPKRGMVSPIEFIPIFERNGFIVQLDFYVYEEVMRVMRSWIDTGKNVVPVAINVSRVHISSVHFVEQLMTLIEQYQIPTNMIEVELTESVLGDEDSNILNLLNQLKAAGFKISIDDFGTGYSSLNLLKEMPVDILKIDKSFLNETENSEKSRIIIEQVVSMAKKIHIETICEGVETQKQAEFLKEIGCNMVQGYLYAKPMPRNEFEEMF